MASLAGLSCRFCGAGDAVARLSERVMARYLAFARHGDPNGEGMPDWPTYDTAARPTLLFDDEARVAPGPLDATRAFWAAQ